MTSPLRQQVFVVRCNREYVACPHISTCGVSASVPNAVERDYVGRDVGKTNRSVFIETTSSQERVEPTFHNGLLHYFEQHEFTINGICSPRRMKHQLTEPLTPQKH